MLTRRELIKRAAAVGITVALGPLVVEELEKQRRFWAGWKADTVGEVFHVPIHPEALDAFLKGMEPYIRSHFDGGESPKLISSTGKTLLQ